jgi:hypothetical protein
MAKRHGRRRQVVALPLLPSLAVSPPAIQLQTGKLIASEWNDPADDSPNRRSAKVVKHYRRCCPLRLCIRRHGANAGYSPKHLVAADRLRHLANGSTIGFQGERPLGSVADVRQFLSSETAVRQWRCGQELRRVRGLFGDADWGLLMAVIIGNVAIQRHAAATGQNVKLVKQRLVGLLDKLVAWFGLRPMQGAA